MGEVIPFPGGVSRPRTKRRVWVVLAVLSLSVVLGGAVLAGRDLLRGAQADRAPDRSQSDIRVSKADGPSPDRSFPV